MVGPGAVRVATRRAVLVALALFAFPATTSTSAVLTFSTYLPGLSGRSVGYAIAIGADGDMYVGGQIGCDRGINGAGFVTRVAAGGTGLKYTAIVDGSGGTPTIDDCIHGVAVDAAGNAYAVGRTFNSSFAGATTTGCDTFTGVRAFVAKLSTTGVVTQVLCLSAGRANAAAVDGSGRVYVTGGNGFDAFVARVNSTFTGTDYLRTIGGTGPDIAVGLAVKAAGEAYITGTTESADFPVVSAFQAIYGGVGDVFVAAFSGSGSVAYASYLEGAHPSSQAELLSARTDIFTSRERHPRRTFQSPARGSRCWQAEPTLF
jgi:hypothetical protein